MGTARGRLWLAKSHIKLERVTSVTTRYQKPWRAHLWELFSPIPEPIIRHDARAKILGNTQDHSIGHLALVDHHHAVWWKTQLARENMVMRVSSPQLVPGIRIEDDASTDAIRLQGAQHILYSRKISLPAPPMHDVGAIENRHRPRPARPQPLALALAQGNENRDQAEKQDARDYHDAQCPSLDGVILQEHKRATKAQNKKK